MNRKIIGALLLAALALPAVAAQPKGKRTDPAERGGVKYITGDAPRTLEGGWVLNWNDEFDGSKLDLNKWAYELGVVRNHGSSQAYTKECVEVKGGMLRLHTIAKPTRNKTYKSGSTRWNEKIKEQPYASGSVTTRGVKHFKSPGRLEFRARIPKAKGVWPALWTLHLNKYTWPANGEIDILEHISQEPNTVYTVFRWGKNGTQQEYTPISTKTQIPDLSKDFHTYVLEWDDEVMRTLIDGKEVAHMKIDRANYPDGTNPLRTPCYLIMNTAVGGPGTWPEKPDASQYPVTFEIDYVRYYTKKDRPEAEQPNGVEKTPEKKNKQPAQEKS